MRKVRCQLSGQTKRGGHPRQKALHEQRYSNQLKVCVSGGTAMAGAQAAGVGGGGEGGVG